MPQVLSINIALLLPASLIFIALLLHCYFYRGLRLTLTFFGSAFLHTLIKELTHIYMENRFPFVLRPYWVLGARFQIFGLPLVICFGWAITFYLSWCLAERILKKIDYFSETLFPTIVWSLLIAGAISYCVETTAIFSGWWLWTFPDYRLKDFIVVPFSALLAWPAQTAEFLLIFFLSECSKYRLQWWRVFLYNLICGAFVFGAVNYSLMHFWRSTQNILDIIRFLIPILLMFFYSTRLQFTRLRQADSKRGVNPFFYDAITMTALALMIFTCIYIDTAVLRNPALVISTLPLVLFIVLSIKRLRFPIIIVLLIFALTCGGRGFYIILIAPGIFFMFVIYGKLLEKIRNE